MNDQENAAAPRCSICEDPMAEAGDEFPDERVCDKCAAAPQGYSDHQIRRMESGYSQ